MWASPVGWIPLNTRRVPESLRLLSRVSSVVVGAVRRP